MAERRGRHERGLRRKAAALADAQRALVLPDARQDLEQARLPDARRAVDEHPAGGDLEALRVEERRPTLR